MSSSLKRKRVTLQAMLICIAAAGATLPFGMAEAKDYPTREYYAGKTQLLPDFPYMITARQGTESVDLIFSSPFSLPVRQRHISSAQATQSTDSAYWVISPSDWSAALAPFIRGRTALGQNIRVVTIEEIQAAYPEISDPALQLKTALKDGYDSGVRYALLVGDAEKCPVRYAYDGRVSAPPALDQQQICDLYFGEFDGVWDADGDGVFGEPSEDSADLLAEVLIGRLPFSNASEVAAWVNKWEQYVFARGNTAYLGRVLGMASDQMRDDNFGLGQAARVVRGWPDALAQDTTSLLESPSGNTLATIGPHGSSVVSKWNEGWGIVHMYTHGRFDGFALKTSLYNTWPKSYVLTDPDAVLPHASLSDLSGPAGLVYSVACNQAAFDAEIALGGATGRRCVAAELLASEAGGAVTFVGYSRWGWVFSSHYVARTFWEGIFDSSYSVGRALQRAKLTYPYLLDVVYGHNIYGDPALMVWAGVPEPLELLAQDWFSAAGGSLPIVISGSGSLDQCRVTLMTEDGQRLALAQTNASGECELEVPVLAPQRLTVTAFGPGFAPVQKEIEISLSSGTGDDAVLPTQTSMGNYPNPFNGTTRIVFGHVTPGRWRLEIYNTIGRLVHRKSLTMADLASGVNWNPAQSSGGAASSGLFFARLVGDGTVATHKLLLLK